MKKIHYIISLLLIFTLVAAGCGKKEEKGINIVTTNSILYDMTKQVAGDKAKITNIVPVGSDPHEYEVKPKDIAAFSDADAIIYNGLNLETGTGWFQSALKQSNKDLTDKSVIAASDGVEKIYLEGQPKSDKYVDPHAWLSIQNGMKYVRNIEKKLSSVDPENKEVYKANSDRYIKKLEKLDKKYTQQFNDIPKDRRHLITSEGAFKYFSRDYDIHHNYIWEINTEKQGTTEQMKNITDYIKKNKVKSLFVETSVDKRRMETLSKETDTPIFGEVFTDSIGNKESNADSYYKMMEHNIKTIHEGMK